MPSPPPSASASGSSTPNPSARFTAPAASVEDRLKADTFGLVTLSDFRKRRAEALSATQGDSTPGSGASTPDGREPASKPAFKKRKKGLRTGGLSFGDDEEGSASASGEAENTSGEMGVKKRGLGPNVAVGIQPRVLTKAALLRETQTREQLKREYTEMQAAVKATEFVLPFVFYDGRDSPGGVCRMKKGDHIWLFLERARKVGAADGSRKDWARISVDDLMVVRGDLIIPHHYDFHYFLINKAIGYRGIIFPYSATPTAATPQLDARSGTATPDPQADDNISHLQTAMQRKAAIQSGPPDSELEGFGDSPSATKVVDRRWYERNKHIYPASSWEEYDATRDYSSGARKDKDGNAMFFSR